MCDPSAGLPFDDEPRHDRGRPRALQVRHQGAHAPPTPEKYERRLEPGDLESVAETLRKQGLTASRRVGDGAEKPAPSTSESYLLEVLLEGKRATIRCSTSQVMGQPTEPPALCAALAQLELRLSALSRRR